MNIFNTIYKGEYKATLRSLRFNLLQKLAGANAEKFECFRPVISGLPTQESEQERKAEFVQLFIDMLNAGVNFDTLPTGCGCEELVGNVCNITGSGYAELVAGISGISLEIEPQVRTICQEIPFLTGTSVVNLPPDAVVLTATSTFGDDDSPNVVTITKTGPSSYTIEHAVNATIVGTLCVHYYVPKV